MLLGISSFPENYESMKEAFGAVFTVISALNNILRCYQQLNDLYDTSMNVHLQSTVETVKFRIKCGGDFKSISMIMGHGG